MKVQPDYYEKFHCIAGECKHTCCAGWEIDFDEPTYQRYIQVPGELGEKFRKYIKNDKKHELKFYHGKCPFLSKSHLCTIYQTLGPDSLSEVCALYPRFEVNYGAVSEKALSISCEEVGRLVIDRTEPICLFVEKEEEELGAEYQFYERARKRCFQILKDRNKPLSERIHEFITYAADVRPKGHKLVKVQDESLHKQFIDRMSLVEGMEPLEAEWEEEILNVMRAFYKESHQTLYIETLENYAQQQPNNDIYYENLLLYFAYRYLLYAVEDGDFLLNAKFCVFCTEVIKDMDLTRFLMLGQSFSMQDRIETARLFSRQVEHSKLSMNHLLKGLSA